VADAGDHTVRKVDVTGGVVTLFAGQHGSAGFSGDQGSLPGQFNQPISLASSVFSGGFLACCDHGNGRVRLLLVPQN